MAKDLVYFNGKRPSFKFVSCAVANISLSSLASTASSSLSLSSSSCIRAKTKKMFLFYFEKSSEYCKSDKVQARSQPDTSQFCRVICCLFSERLEDQNLSTVALPNFTS